MKINLKLRFRNTAVLIPLITAAVALVYQVLGIIGVVAPVSESQVINVITAIVNALALMGILIDPTTQGIGDSEQALDYTSPRVDEVE